MDVFTSDYGMTRKDLETVADGDGTVGTREDRIFKICSVKDQTGETGVGESRTSFKVVGIVFASEDAAEKDHIVQNGTVEFGVDEAAVIKNDIFEYYVLGCRIVKSGVLDAYIFQSQVGKVGSLDDGTIENSGIGIDITGCVTPAVWVGTPATDATTKDGSEQDQQKR